LASEAIRGPGAESAANEGIRQRLVFGRNADIYFTDPGNSSMNDPTGRVLRRRASDGEVEMALYRLPGERHRPQPLRDGAIRECHADAMFGASRAELRRSALVGRGGAVLLGETVTVELAGIPLVAHPESARSRTLARRAFHRIRSGSGRVHDPLALGTQTGGSTLRARRILRSIGATSFTWRFGQSVVIAGCLPTPDLILLEIVAKRRHLPCRFF
jgi:hypothetical protein